MLHTLTFPSDGLQLAGLLWLPDAAPHAATSPASPPLPRPAVILLHGFGASKADGMVTATAELLQRLGYITLRFDMRGCGDSEGERARVLCEEQVADASNAVSYLLTRPEVDAARIVIMGHSFGAAVAVYTAATDPRIAACISSAGWGDGATKFRQQHASPEAWARFEAMMAEGQRLAAQGESLRVPRFDIVPIPPHLRAGLPAGAFMDFPFEVVQSMHDFRPNDVVGQIAPRPLLLLHPSQDSVTPTAQSIDLFRHAQMPVDLHLFAEIDHFIFSDDNTLVLNLFRDWLAKHLPDPAPAGPARATSLAAEAGA